MFPLRNEHGARNNMGLQKFSLSNINKMRDVAVEKAFENYSMDVVIIKNTDLKIENIN